MKIIFDHSQPFSFAHGGFQTQIEQTRKGLEDIGLEAEWLRWWDGDQRGDLVHYFGTAPAGYLRLARSMGIPTVMTTLFTATCNRPDRILRMQGATVRTILRLPFGGGIKRQLEWRSFGLCDLNVVGLEAERQVLDLVYGVPSTRTAVVPLGLSDRFLSAACADRSGDHLICVGTITERKCSVELADLARQAEVPILFVGKPYTEADPYWKTFATKIDQKWVRYQPHMSSEEEMIALLRQARGCVIKSWYENWCLAAHEAAACGLPLLLPDQKWSRERFGSEASYFPGNARGDEETLRRFFHHSRESSPPKVQLYSWREVATQLRPLYEAVARTSR